MLENPQVQEWLEEQRRKLIVLLRSIGEDLDPESRRAAEAFAFEGRTPATDAGLRREASGSTEAAAVATGRCVGTGGIRRIPVRGPSDPDEAAERRRQGREYLARRNQQMHEMQERRKVVQALEGDEAGSPSTPTSFDALVDDEGKLRLLSPRPCESASGQSSSEMREVEGLPLLAEESSSSADAFHLGSRLADPFSDEYAMERSQTPKPPVPPKIELVHDEVPDPPMAIPEDHMPIAHEHHRSAPLEESHADLSYEEQLAIALSLSEVETTTNAATVRQSQPAEYDDELRAAIAASLKDMDDQQAAHAVAYDEPLTPQPSHANVQPLVDLTPASFAPQRMQHPGQGDWEAIFDHPTAPSHESWSVRQPAPPSEAPSDELYRITPQLTQARLATLEAQQESSPPSSIPYDPVREAASAQRSALQHQHMDASFYSAPSSVAPPAPHAEAPPQLVDISSGEPNHLHERARTPTSAAAATAPSSFGFDTDTESDTFASVLGTPSPPRTQSRLSDVEVVDVTHDSDVDLLSEEGDGVVTPDSWTEVESRDGESEEGGEERRPIASS